ncbi:MAG: glycosyltransferase 87 family protein [bacterium]
MRRLAILGATALVALFYASRIPDPLGNFVAFLWPVAAAFMLCMHAFRTAREDADTARLERRGIVLAMAIGAAMRVAFIATPPSLSSDVYRYVWDARAQAAGVNPFLYPPNAPEVRDLYDVNATYINHQEISTIYPPVSQAAFRVAEAIAPGPTGMKILFGFIDLAIPLLALAALRPPPGARLPVVLLLAWHPLSVIETAGSGHNDPLGIALLLGAVACARAGFAMRAGALLGAAAAAKTMPILLAPLFAIALGRRGAGRFAAALAAVIAFAYFPFADAGAALFRGLTAYSLDLEFNAGLYAIVRALVRASASPDSAIALAPRLLPLLPALAAPLLWRLARGDLARAAFWTLGALVLLSSQVHPWYLLWLLPFLAVRPSRAWLLFTFLIFISYETHALHRASGAWSESTGIRAIQYAPLFILLAIEAAASIARARRGAAPVRDPAAGEAR